MIRDLTIFDRMASLKCTGTLDFVAITDLLKNEFVSIALLNLSISLRGHLGRVHRLGHSHDLEHLFRLGWLRKQELQETFSLATDLTKPHSDAVQLIHRYCWRFRRLTFRNSILVL